LAPLLVALLLAACSVEPPSPEAAAAAPAPARAANGGAPPAVESRDTASLEALATRALLDNRLHSPAGDNAVEASLALRERAQRPNPGIETALLDLSPYVVNGVEQATAEGDLGEAARRLVLLQRIDAEAPVSTAASPAASAMPPATAPTSPATPAATPATRRVVAQSSPRFPEQALRRRLEGRVELALSVAPDGRVTGAEVLSSSDAVFEREAVLAARRWRYAPADAMSEVRASIAFRLPDPA
jgi:protein TonB